MTADYNLTHPRLWRTKLATYFTVSCILVVVASFSSEFWWLPLIPLAVASVFIFLAGEASEGRVPQRARIVIPVLATVPLLVSIGYQIAEDLSRDYSSNAYSLTNPLFLIHSVVALGAFTFAYRGGERFADRGFRSRSASRSLRALQVLAVPLLLLSILYFLGIGVFASSEWDLLEASGENMGLLYAHLTFAIVLLVTSVATLAFSTRRLRLARRGTEPHAERHAP